MELSKAAETLSLNRFGNSAFLLIRILIGALILLVTVTISSASFNPSRASIAVLPNHTSLTNALNTRQTQTKARLCRAEALSEESSEHCRDCSADKAIDGDLNTRWSSKFQDPQWITVTLCEEKTINQVVLYWETAYARYYQLQVSQDGETWYKVFSTHNGDGGEDVITFEPITARYVRMCGFLRGTQWGYSLWEFEVFEANDPPVVPISCPLISKGYYPRWFYKELGYWTVVGSPGSYAENLFSDDGMIGNPRNGFSLIPYLKIAGKLITAFDTMTITHFLEDEYLPFPEVRWSYGDIEFKQKVFPYQAGAGDSQNYVWYRLENKGSTTINGSLYLTVRPFQVRPPWMHGGLQKIRSVEILTDCLRVKINGYGGFSALTAPDDCGAMAYEDGGIMDDVLDFIEMGILPPTRTATSSGGYASAALEYRYALGPGAKRDFVFAIPMDKSIDESELPSTPAEAFDASAESHALWEEILNRATVESPNQDIVHTLKSNVAYIIINQDGQAFQPGSDNYDRSWMRDGTEIGLALLKTGFYTDVKEYLRWVASFQREDGLIPPIIDPDGGIPEVKEWDSQGEFIFLASEYYKYTQDRQFLEQIFPNVERATIFLKNLREQRRTPGYENTRFYGILPPSICHEGYKDPGKHCYWDDFWALKGWQEARELARELGRDALVSWMDEEFVDFSRDLVNSIKRTMNEFCIDYIPGSADDGDFDATSTAIAVWLTDQTDLLKREGLLPALEYTLDKYYYENFLPRLVHGVQFGYTPYEMRIAGAYLMLGQKDKALNMLNYFLRDRRPLEWNQWAEVVHPGYRDPGYVGDMPHSWIGALYINLAKALFVHEKRIYLPIVFSNYPPRVTKIALLTHHGKYVTAMSSCPYLKQDGWLRDCSLFTLQRMADGKIALITCHNTFITSPKTGATDQDWALRQEPELSECGKFTLHDLGNGKFALETCAHRYVTALDGNRPLKEQWLVIAGANEVWEWEQFTLVAH